MKKSRKKRIAIIGTVGVPARYGGFETLAHNLVEHLGDTYDLHVYASKKNYSKKERVKTWKGARVHYLPFAANGISSVIYDIVSMIHAMFIVDQILILGVSGGIFVPFIKLFSKARVIVNIDGMEWRRDKWNKWARRFLRFSERVAVRFSDADITDNLAIKRYTAIHYKTASHLIAYGADHVSRQRLSKSDHQKYAFLSRPYAFKVARIEPENNIEMILSAFSKTANKTLVLVGNWDNSEYGRRLKVEYGKHKNMFLLDPVYDQVELDKLRSNCFLYVHGHSAGGTNPSLVEAMFLGLPVMAFDVSYNRATMHNHGVYFRSEEELIDRLETTPYSQLKSLKFELGKIARQQYTWKNIVCRYSSIFESFDFAYVKPKIDRKNAPVKYTDLLNMGYAHLESTKLFYEWTPKEENHGK